MDATERDKLGGAQDAAQVTAIVIDILSTNVAVDSAKLGGRAASSYVVDDGTGAWNNNENGGGHSSTNWYEVVATYGIFGGLYLDGGEIHMGDDGTGGGDIWLDNGKLYMSNSASAYLYGGENGWGPMMKVGGGSFSLAGNFLCMNGGSGSGGAILHMDGGFIGMNGGSGSGGGDLWLDSGKLYMRGWASAYFYGNETGGVHTIKVGNGALDLEGSSGIIYHPPLGNLSMGVYTNR
jgi:hypothetical protein